nr:uncharacterized protein LOC106061839 [Ipomoea batatas]
MTPAARHIRTEESDHLSLLTERIAERENDGVTKERRGERRMRDPERDNTELTKFRTPRPDPAEPNGQAPRLAIGSAKADHTAGSAKADLLAGSAKADLPVGSTKADLPAGSVKADLPVGPVKADLPAGSAIPVGVDHLGQVDTWSSPVLGRVKGLRVGQSLAAFITVQGGCNSPPSSPG